MPVNRQLFWNREVNKERRAVSTGVMAAVCLLSSRGKDVEFIYVYSTILGKIRVENISTSSALGHVGAEKFNKKYIDDKKVIVS